MFGLLRREELCVQLFLISFASKKEKSNTGVLLNGRFGSIVFRDGKFFFLTTTKMNKLFLNTIQNIFWKALVFNFNLLKLTLSNNSNKNLKFLLNENYMDFIRNVNINSNKAKQ